MGDGGPSKVSQNEVADGWFLFLFFVSCLFWVGFLGGLFLGSSISRVWFLGGSGYKLFLFFFVFLFNFSVRIS